MIGTAAPPNLFTASAFNALIAMRRYMAQYGVAPSDACTALVSLNPDFASSNQVVAGMLHDLLPASLEFVDITVDRQHSLHLLIEAERPWWRKLFKSGRSMVVTALTDDEKQVFADAGLLESPPTAAILTWWYRIAAIVRAEQDQVQSEQGGEAELRTLAYERERLAALGIARDPELVGFENHGFGYDVKSYDPGVDEPIARLIEVKSSMAQPPRMVVPRSEWDAAAKFGSRFFFYLWHGAGAETLTILTAAEVAVHMPSDHGDGAWRKVEVTLPGL